MVDIEAIRAKALRAQLPAWLWINEIARAVSIGFLVYYGWKLCELMVK